MGRTYHKLSALQREKVWELREKGVAGTKVAELLAAGFPREDPPIPKVKITPQAVNGVYRTLRLERDQLYYQRLAHIPTADVLALNRRKLSQIAAAELERQRQRQVAGKLDGEELRRLAGAIERIEKLEVNAAKREPVGDPEPRPRPHKGDQEQEDKAPSFADSLLAEAAEREAEDDGDPQPEADPPGDEDQDGAVPDDLPRQDTGEAPRTTANAGDGSTSAASASV